MYDWFETRGLYILVWHKSLIGFWKYIYLDSEQVFANCNSLA